LKFYVNALLNTRVILIITKFYYYRSSRTAKLSIPENKKQASYSETYDTWCLSEAPPFTIHEARVHSYCSYIKSTECAYKSYTILLYQVIYGFFGIRMEPAVGRYGEGNSPCDVDWPSKEKALFSTKFR